MNGTRRRLATATTWAVTVAWVMSYTITVAIADQPPEPVTAVVQLVGLTLGVVGAALGARRTLPSDPARAGRIPTT